jgi:hypothetical protein
MHPERPSFYTLAVASDEELKAWEAGADVEGARAGRGRSGVAAQWWGMQAAVVGFASVYLGVTSGLWWFVLLPVAAWQAYRAVLATRRQETWEQLYGEGTTRRF